MKQGIRKRRGEPSSQKTQRTRESENTVSSLVMTPRPAEQWWPPAGQRTQGIARGRSFLCSTGLEIPGFLM
ncbi:hypothetical protein E2C01_100031 [Portunus trituberculatus]|uniref:Uncharacterized protein n=1 Tax=Portunus trituberculatus TaxID=210409 RepID=A0A5B7KB00_PORTR|nr:hypothetical protein [Portunus trituberculatus]